MKYIMCQPAIKRFEWELEVAITRLQKLGITDIVLLFSKHDPSVPPKFVKMGCDVHVYEDLRISKRYIPSIKPYLWMRYLIEDPSRQMGSYFYMDSDVILRDIPNVEPKTTIWYGSKCDSYLGVPYIDSKGPELLDEMCRVVNINPSLIRECNPVAGAQWVIKTPTIDYWEKVYNDSVKLYDRLCELEPLYVSRNDNGYVPIQKWTAEMWAQLWNIYYFAREAKTHPELEFCWPTEDISRYYETKILHNAGVIDANRGLFFKGQYTNRTPYNDDLYFVPQNKASYAYVQAILETAQKL